jgi:hypothetical protein
MPLDDLRAKLAKADPSVLVDFLVRLAGEGGALAERIDTLAEGGDTGAVAASLAARLKRFRARRRPISYGESGAVAGELHAWLDDLESQLLPADPAAAWKLVERFIRSDEQIIGRADDSNGAIGDTFRRACGLWLRAAAALPADPAWVERIHALHAGSDYGTRDALLDEAATRLSELELRRLARIYEQEALAAPKNDTGYRGLAAAAAMGQVARALGDAALYERSVRIYSPRLNDLQAADVAREYLRSGPVERAVELLTGVDDDDDRFRDERLDLLAEAYEKLGDPAALRDARRRLCEGSLSAKRLRAYAALLPPAEADRARREALERAERSDSPVVAGAFLLDLGEDERAGALVLRLRERLGAAYYEDLLALARRFEKSSQPVAAVACYRALADQILDAGRSTAYRHAKRYVDRSAALDAAVRDERVLPGHARYLAELRDQHGRKSSFWRLFAPKGSAGGSDSGGG